MQRRLRSPPTRRSPMLSGRLFNWSEGEGEGEGWRQLLMGCHLVVVEVQVPTHVEVSDAIGKGLQLE